MGKSKTQWTDFWEFLEIMQEQTREADKWHQNQQKDREEEELKDTKEAGIICNWSLKMNVIMNDYEKISPSHILGVIQRLYSVYLCVNHQTTFTSAPFTW